MSEDTVEKDVRHALIGPTTDSTDPRWTCLCGEEISRSGWTADLNFADHLTSVTSPGESA